MDYFKDAFGSFSPQTDDDAALKLSLDALLADHRVSDLAAFISTESVLWGIEGEPGWIIERRDAMNDEHENWPPDANFRAYVNPDVFPLGHSEFFCDQKAFYRYVQSIVDVYAARYPGRANEIKKLQYDLHKVTRFSA